MAKLSGSRFLPPDIDDLVLSISLEYVSHDNL